MKIFKEAIEIRWADLDANMHVANKSYMIFTAHARMRALNKMGVTMQNLHKWQRGPVIFEEKFQFFKELMPDSTVYVHTKLSAVSEDLCLFEFMHKLYNEQGQHSATSVIFGCWMDMKVRKIARFLPEEMMEKVKQLDINKMRQLSMSDLKALPYKASNIDKEELI